MSDCIESCATRKGTPWVCIGRCNCSCHVEPSDPAQGVKRPWICFHCEFETTDAKEAAAHFGDRDDAEEFKPICKWWARMDDHERLETLQDTIEQLNEAHSDYATLSADKIAAESFEQNGQRILWKDQAEFLERELNNFRRNAAHRAEQLAEEKVKAAEAELERVKQERDDYKRKLGLIIDGLYAHDSYGVEGSSFTTCLLCDGGSSPGKADFAHKPTCLLADGELERKVSEIWNHEELEAAESNLAALRQALGFDQPFPVTDVLLILSAAASHALNDHNCDHLHERTTTAMSRASEIVKALASLDGGKQ